jgi:nitroreductase/NAD-dependent dihydropyrimidine dehydrogenase PreA subunit
MALFTIDSEKCNKDGICADVCPFNLIDFKNREQPPIPIDHSDEACIDCGHCVSVCPQGALSHRIMRPEDCRPIDRGLMPTEDQMEQFFRSRRTIRCYKKDPVDRTVIEKLIESAAYAPSGHNVQPANWHVIYDSGRVRRFSDMTVEFLRPAMEAQPEFARRLHIPEILAGHETGQDMIFRGAPHVIMCHAPADERTAPVGCVIALTYLELAASALGLGTCWAGYFNSASENYPPLKEELNLPEGHQSFGALAFGFPKYRFKRIPIRNKARVSWD